MGERRGLGGLAREKEDTTPPEASLPDTTPPDTVPLDTTPTPDAVGGPVVIQAENYKTQKSLDGTYNWVVKSDVSGYSGSGFIQASPTNVYENCGTNITTCGAQADYAFTAATSGTHYFHFRVNYDDSNSNSLRWGVDGTQKTAVSSATFGQWFFITRSTSVTVGAHTLNIWMREYKARLDLIAITTTSQPPPVP